MEEHGNSDAAGRSLSISAHHSERFEDIVPVTKDIGDSRDTASRVPSSEGATSTATFKIFHPTSGSKHL
jgi:hypothetical protein